ADVLVLNKADRPGTEAALRALRASLEIGYGVHARSGWLPPIVPTVATEGQGITELLDHINAHRAYLHETGLWQQQEREHLRAELELRLRETLYSRHLNRLENGQLSAILDKLQAREIDPTAAVMELLGVED
ncbi:MAG: hypothetical protein NZM11_12085, partial [Anaerolineales bacterium]|nr:hypothetical protein [Anaerolineales bacterium]